MDAMSRLTYDSFPDDPNDHGPRSTRSGAGVTSSIINIANTIIGAGILAMPYGYRSNGIILGTLIIVLSGITAGLGLFLQGVSSKFVGRGHASFFSLSNITYPSLSILFDTAIAIKCFGVGVSYIIIIGDLMPQVMESLGLTGHEFLVNRQFWVLLSFGIVGPLCFLRKLDSLKYTSVVALAAVGYLVLVVVAHYLVGDTKDQRGPINVVEPESISSILSSLPIIVFAFTCHQNMFSVLNELSVPSIVNIEKIIGMSIGTSGFFYILVGLTGYLSFGNNVGGNIIGMYSYNVFSTIGRIAIVILVVFSYPLQCHPCRASLNHIVHWCQTHLNKDEQLLTDDQQDIDSSIVQSNGIVPLSNLRFILVTSVILALSLATALSVSSLEMMLAFVGSTGSTSISFILPGVFGYSLLGHAEAEIVTGFSSRTVEILRKTALGLVIWGIIVFVVCLGTNIWIWLL